MRAALTEATTALAAFAGVEEAIAELGRQTSVRTILAAAPGALCARTPFRRVLVSVLACGSASPLVLEDGDDQLRGRALEDELRRTGLRFAAGGSEAEAARRRRATIVPGLLAAPTVDAARPFGPDGYVLAPVSASTEVRALLHADMGSRGSVGSLEVEVLEDFASELSALLTVVSLRASLRRDREQLRDVVEWLDMESSPSSLLTAPSLLRAALEEISAPDRRPHGSEAPTSDLSRRELEVLALLATGSANHAIAAELVIAESTVKSHVRRIIEKLGVANRAQAIAAYRARRGRDRPA